LWPDEIFMGTATKCDRQVGTLRWRASFARYASQEKEQS
jgi:hypothetical protein